MADQTLVQNDAIKGDSPEKRKRANGPLRKFARGWNFGICCARYALSGERQGVQGLVDLVVGDHTFVAWQIPEELRALGEILFTLRPERALEIGTASGGSLLFLTRLASPQATIVTLDLPGGGFGGGYRPARAWFYKRFARSKQQLHLLRGNSHSSEMLAQVVTLLGGCNLDYLFIDGDHSYSGVKSDFEMYGPMVRKGGVIAFHDIVEGPANEVGGVPQFWREIRRRYQHAEFITNPHQGGFGIGVLHVE